MKNKRVKVVKGEGQFLFTAKSDWMVFFFIFRKKGGWDVLYRLNKIDLHPSPPSPPSPYFF